MVKPFDNSSSVRVPDSKKFLHQALFIFCGSFHPTHCAVPWPCPSRLLVFLLTGLPPLAGNSYNTILKVSMMLLNPVPDCKDIGKAEFCVQNELVPVRVFCQNLLFMVHLVHHYDARCFESLHIFPDDLCTHFDTVCCIDDDYTRIGNFHRCNNITHKIVVAGVSMMLILNFSTLHASKY